MNQDVIQPKRRAGSVARVFRVLLTVAALTGAGLSLAGCYGMEPCGFEGDQIAYC